MIQLELKICKFVIYKLHLLLLLTEEGTDSSDIIYYI